jgi:hypothetical protein
MRGSGLGDQDTEIFQADARVGYAENQFRKMRFEVLSFYVYHAWWSITQKTLAVC